MKYVLQNKTCNHTNQCKKIDNNLLFRYGEEHTIKSPQAMTSSATELQFCYWSCNNDNDCNLLLTTSWLVNKFYVFWTFACTYIFQRLLSQRVHDFWTGFLSCSEQMQFLPGKTLHCAIHSLEWCTQSTHLSNLYGLSAQEGILLSFLLVRHYLLHESTNEVICIKKNLIFFKWKILKALINRKFMAACDVKQYILQWPMLWIERNHWVPGLK